MQQLVDLTSHGWIALSNFSHLRPDAFSGAVVADPDKDIGYRCENSMKVEPLPGAPLVMIQTEVVLAAQEVLFDIPSTGIEAQAESLSRAAMQMHEEAVAGLGIASRPVDQ